jgi:S1-C subfamily serine protease
MLAALLAGLAAPARAEDPALSDLDIAEAVSRAGGRAAERVRPAVVSIRAKGPEGQEYGAGIVVAEEGLVLTALHVVRQASSLHVRTAGGSEHVATVHATDGPADLALLRIEAEGATFPVAQLGDDARMLPGESVLVVGNPFGLGGTVTRGILSATGRRGVVPDNVVPLLQTDAAINPGSSGGALVNLRGEVIGLVNAILTRTGSSQGVGFAVPASEIRSALPYLVKGEAPHRAWIGVRVRPRTPAADGLVVTSVVPGGPAAAAGVRDGDVLLRMGAAAIAAPDDLRRELLGSSVGDVAVLAILRDGKPLEIEARIGRRP